MARESSRSPLGARRGRAWAVLVVVALVAVSCGIDPPAPPLPPGAESAAAVSPQSAAPAAAALQGTAYDWPQFNGDAQHSGNNTQEALLAPGTVGLLRILFKITLPDAADGAAAYLSGVTLADKSIHDLLFLNTASGHIVAVDAHTGSQIWAHQNGPGSCTINGGGRPCYTTSSPAVDPNRAFVYAYGLDGNVHKYAVGDGAEVTTGGWPQPATLKGSVEKGSSALTVASTPAGSFLYVANGGYPGDAGDYQGHLTTINLATGTQKVFNLVCSDQTVHFVISSIPPGSPDCPEVQTAVWARAGVIYLPATGLIYGVTGNGLFAPASHDWGDTVFALHPDGTGAAGDPLATYTPGNFQALQNGDADLGSTTPAILPVPSTSKIAHLAVQGGKDAQLRLLNLDNLSGQGGIGHTGGELAAIPIPQGGQMLTAAAVWRNPADGSTWTYVANGSGIAGLQLVIDGQGNPSLATRWQQTQGGSSPIVANGVLYYAGSTGSGGGYIRALDPVTGHQLWQDAATLGSIHWESPIVANGALYITDAAGLLVAYTLPNLAEKGYLPDVSR